MATSFGSTPVSDKKVSTTVYVTRDQLERLKQLHARTKVPIAEYIREGINLVDGDPHGLTPGPG